MTQRKQKLELTWIGKENRPRRASREGERSFRQPPDLWRQSASREGIKGQTL
ncbi:MAG: hypothetical protein KF832_13575 [Caldilineaceae bacterium]|nr:hypothetical protein [Caldilineaceae bacterium]